MPRMTTQPGIVEVIAAVRTVGAALKVERATYCFEGRFRITLAGDWSLMISPETAGRIRVAACYRGRERATMWSRSDDYARLTVLALSARSEALALV